MTGTARGRLCAALASIAALQALLPLVADGGAALLRMGAVVAAVTIGAAVALAAASGRGTDRRTTAHRALDAALAGVGGALAGGACVVATSVRGEALLGVLPTARGRADLAALWHAGRVDIGSYAPPVPLSAGMLLILCTAALGVALAVDVLAVGLGRPALAGLPLLGVLVVPAALAPHGIGGARFAVGALGFLLLLASDAPRRVRGWLGAGAGDTDAGRRPVAPATGWVAGAAVLLALLTPAALPALHRAPIGAGAGDGSAEGPAAVSVADPLVTVRRRLLDRAPHELLRYRTDGPADYLRLTSLDRFDGDEWSQSTLRQGSDHLVRRGLPPVPGLSAAIATREVRLSVRVGPTLLEHWLPLPYPPTATAVGGDWKYDDASRVVFSARDDTRRLEYTATSLAVEPTPAQLAAAPVDAAGPPAPASGLDPTQQTGPLPAALPALAQRVAGTGSRFKQALRLQRFFLDGFRYDLSVPGGNGLAAVERLLRTRRGYCEQFASAMALLARVVGIPSRVAIGFTPGTELGDGDRLVTTHDAHSWPELWFPGTGWLRFEPTPRGDGQAEPPPWSRDGRGAPALAAPRPTAAPRASSRPEDAPGHRAAPRPAPRLAQDRAPLAVRAGHGPPAWPLLLVLLGLPAAARAAQRRRRRAAAATPDAPGAHAAWAELTATARDLGLPPDPASTPRSTARRLATLVGAPGAAALEALAVAEERARYARTGAAPTDRPLADLLVTAVRGLRRSAPRRRRSAALLLPASLLPTASLARRAWVSRPARRGAASSAPPSAPRWSGAAGRSRRSDPAGEVPAGATRRRRPRRTRTGASSR